MQIIDKTKNSIKLLFTLTEKVTISNANFLLVLYSHYNKTTHRFNLPSNTSAYQFRFDEFIFSNTVFNELKEGVYYYSVYQSSIVSTDESSMGEPIELGLLKVIDALVNDFVSLPTNETDDDFIVYQGN